MGILRAVIFIMLVSVVICGVLQGLMLKKQLLALNKAEALSEHHSTKNDTLNQNIKRWMK